VEDWTEIKAEWKGESTFTGSNEMGGSVQMGSLVNKPGLSPMQLLLTAIAGCTGTDIVTILQKKRLNPTDLKIMVRARRAAEYPRIWTDIHLTYLVWGERITPKDMETAIQLSEQKYCSVGIMLGKSASITSEYQILKPDEKPG
jgi:putative redox protein